MFEITEANTSSNVVIRDPSKPKAGPKHLSRVNRKCKHTLADMICK